MLPNFQHKSLRKFRSKLIWVDFHAVDRKPSSAISNMLLRPSSKFSIENLVFSSRISI